MKFTQSMIKKCMVYKCKTCPDRLTCDKKEKLEGYEEPLTYKPFENLMEILHGKNEERNTLH